MNKKIILLSSLFALSTISSWGALAQSHAEMFNQNINATPISKMKELSVFLSGNNVDNENYVFTKDSAWLNFSRKVNTGQPKFDKKNADIKLWAQSNLQNLKSENVFYPHGQSDVASVLSLWPNAKVYVLTQDSIELKNSIKASAPNNSTSPEAKAKNTAISMEEATNYSSENNKSFLQLAQISQTYEKSSNYTANYDKNFFPSYAVSFAPNIIADNTYNSSKAIAQLSLMGASITNIVLIHQYEYGQVWQTFYTYEKYSADTNAKNSSNFITKIDFEIQGVKKILYLVTYDKTYTLFETFLKQVFNDKSFVVALKNLPEKYWEQKGRDEKLKKYMLDKAEAVLTNEEGARYLLNQEKTRKWQITTEKGINPNTSQLLAQLNMEAINLKEFTEPSLNFKDGGITPSLDKKSKIKNKDEDKFANSAWLIQRQNYKEFLLNRPK